MQLSDLVRLRNRLQEINTSAIKAELEELDGQLSRLFTIPMHLNYQESVGDSVSNLDDVERSIDSIGDNISILISNIEEEIKERTKEFLALGYEINGFIGSNYTDVATERNDRQLPIHDETRSEAIVRIRSYTDWRYPALEIGSGDGTWTEHLVAADPLYIIDRHQEFLDSTLSKFNPVYKSRVRPYLTGLHAGKPESDFSMLPKEQFGFIFAWNVINYLPLKETSDVLRQSFELLRPGGVMMFTFNNCDVPQCVEYVEQGFRSWMPLQLLVDTCKQFGFEIIATRGIEETVHWIEIRKPGTLKTVKAHQTLGKILAVNA